MIHIHSTPQALGQAAAIQAATLLNAAIQAQGSARLLLSTGMSQFETMAALVEQPVPWNKVTMFHLDEYVGLPITHPASFRKYLQERFISQITLQEAVLVDGEAALTGELARLNARFTEAPIDVGLVGIGENGHIAFNDPPCDLHTTDPYIVVTLDERCKAQQVGEGWFATNADVPRQAISMTVHGILQCHSILSIVPHAAKADAIYNTLSQPLSRNVPATALKTHPHWSLYVDDAAASRSGALIAGNDNQ